MNDSFGLAAFRSRTQVLRMEDALHRAGLSAGVIATPREVSHRAAACPFGLIWHRRRR